MAGVVVVFDFDKTIIDCDSDNWVVDELGATDLFNDLLPTMPWNALMDRMMMELHSQGKTIEDIADTLRRAPLHPKTISAIKSAHALGCDLKIVSDANHFFIDTILTHHGLRHCFSEIHTNPSSVDQHGRLRISPYHHDHCCPLCPPNMCKGLVIERIKASALAGQAPSLLSDRFIYLGDGKGDFCPSTKLRGEDFVMPRKGYPVCDVIRDNPGMVKAEIHEWSDWDEQEKILLHLIDSIILWDTPLPSHFNFQTIPTQEPTLQHPSLVSVLLH